MGHGTSNPPVSRADRPGARATLRGAPLRSRIGRSPARALSRSGPFPVVAAKGARSLALLGSPAPQDASQPGRLRLEARRTAGEAVARVGGRARFARSPLEGDALRSRRGKNVRRSVRAFPAGCGAL